MRYRFIGRGEDGGQKTGFLEAPDEQSARQQLQRRRLQVVRLELDHTGPTKTTPQPPAPPSPPEARPAQPPPSRPLPPEPSLWNQLDWRRLGGGLVLAGLLGGAGVVLWKFAGRDRDYRLHLSGHLALVSRQELGDGYLEKVGLDLRLPEPAWQISRDGSVSERGQDGNYHKIERHAQVKFQMGVEGDYTLDVQASLPKPPSQAVLLVEAPGFPPKQRDVKFAPGQDSHELLAQVREMTLHRLKRRETRAAVPVVEAPSNLPKYDPEAPDQDDQ